MRFYIGALSLPWMASAFISMNLFSPERYQFEKFIQKYQKPYDIDSIEGHKRFMNFQQSVSVIKESNNKHKTFKLGLNQFADESFTTLQETMLCCHFPSRDPLHYLRNTPSTQDSMSPLPGSIDWYKKGKVSNVKDQGKCGSCWAFSTTGALESLLRIRHNLSIDLSEQQLLDCSSSNYGCEGGLMDLALDDINLMGGIQSSDDYPYRCEKKTCKINYKKNIPQLKFIPYDYFRPYDIDDMKRRLVENGPICSAVEVDSIDFIFYKEGIYDKEKERHRLNHAVLLTGYHQYDQPQTNDLNYWIIKNSWGTSWGEDGYMRIAMKEGGEGVAGLHLYGVYLK